MSDNLWTFVDIDSMTQYFNEHPEIFYQYKKFIIDLESNPISVQGINSVKTYITIIKQREPQLKTNIQWDPTLYENI